MKGKYFIILIVVLNSCIPMQTCKEDFANNSQVEFKNFEFDHINLISHSERALVGKNNIEILLVGSLATILHNTLISGDIISKNKNENIVIVKRKNVILRYEIYCKDEITEIKVDTLSQ